MNFLFLNVQMFVLTAAAVARTNTFNTNLREAVLSHDQFVITERSGVRLALYHGGYGNGFAAAGTLGQNVSAFTMYIQNIVAFVTEKHIDKVFISIQDPYSAVPILQHTSVLATELMAKLPPWVELGALVASNPKYPWTVTNTNNTMAPTGGLGPLADQKCEPQNKSGSAGLTMDAVTLALCTPTSANEAASFCGSNFTHVPAWTAQGCGDVDPCAAFLTGSYCRGCGACHGLPVVTVDNCTDSHGGDATPAGPCQCPPIDAINDTVLALKPWCPNTLEVAVEMLANLNLEALSVSDGARVFTSIAWDKEDAGVYGSTGVYLKAWRLMRRLVLPTIPSDYVLWHNLHGVSIQSQDELASLIRIGDAGEGSKNPEDSLKSVDCEKLAADGVLKASNVAECIKEVAGMAGAIEAYPEQYWYTGDLKERGCIGCPHGSAQLWVQPPASQSGGSFLGEVPNDPVPVSQIHQCNACLNSTDSSSIVGTCKPYFRYFLPFDDVDGRGSYWDEAKGKLVQAAHYDACMQGMRADGPDGPGGNCPTSCCDCLGCIPCAFDMKGQQPNGVIPYQQLRNSPAPMAAFIQDAWVQSGTLELLQRNPNRTWTMFSLETAHDWDDLHPPQPTDLNHVHTKGLLTGLRNGMYNVSGAGGRHECISRRFGGDTCGTFDGFGTWEWPAFLDMLLELRIITGLNHFAIYEVQWIPPQWFDGGVIPYH